MFSHQSLSLQSDRRWDGATARAKSNPEESGTWIVSKNSDGSINWRHLPIHLVCMQCSNVQPDVLPELEVLVDALILAYPEGASEVDSQGMLPIHVAVTHGASEKILNAICTSFPGGSHVKDKFGRTVSCVWILLDFSSQKACF